MALVDRLKKRLPKTWKGYVILGIILLICITGLQVLLRQPSTTTTDTAKVPVVEIETVSNIDNKALFSTVGTVEAVAEAKLKAENGGRVVAVYTDLGKNVRAGAVIAQLESNRERAAVIQAQGAYDAAIAGAAQGNTSVKEAELAVTSAKNNLNNTLNNSPTVIQSVVTGTIDQFFVQPQSYYPGVLIRVDSPNLRKDRVNLQTSLPALQTAVNQYSDTTRVALVDQAITEARRVVSMIDLIVPVVERDANSATLHDKPLSSYAAGLYAARTSLNSLIASLENSLQGVIAAEEAYSRMRLNGTDVNTSLANAQIKIALGSLRAAQAAYEKTVIRTPISGVVNSLTIKAGDYVSPLQDVALIANNNGLQIVSAVNNEDRERIAVGDQVTINGTATGTITAIAGAIDPNTGKVAIKISLPTDADFSNGSTVKVHFGMTEKKTTDDSAIYIPLSAVKLNANTAQVFTVDNDNKLVGQTVELGMVVNDKVLIKSGLDKNTAIVLDARGLANGEVVEVKNP